MASQGPLFPGTTASLANAGTSENANAWVSPGNVAADDGTESTITAATYDSPDISEILVASNFNFNAVSGTVNGITVEIDRRSIILNSGKDFRVQLATGTTFADLVGTNKAVPATIWPSTSAVATYGGAADTWSAGLTAAQVAAAGFAVFLSAQANIANADIGVDFIRVTVTYTPPTNTTVTPGTAALTTTAFAPTVSVSANQLVTPGKLGLTLTAFAPTVTATDHKLVTPGTAALTTTGLAPTVSTPRLVTPGPVALTLTTFEPTVTAGSGSNQTVTPGTASLSLTAFAPTVVASDDKIVTPGVRALSLTTFAPTVTTTDAVLVTPGPLGLVLTTYAPTVTGSVLPGSARRTLPVDLDADEAYLGVI
jgi:hypothetical protein